MSSSNRVRLAIIPETAYGVTPGTGNFQEVRMTSEDLTGTPQVTESQEIRSDRQTSGQVNTGLELSGGWNVEVTADISLRTMIEQAMMSDEVAALNQADTLSISGVSGDTATLTSIVDLSAAGFQDGDVAVLSGYSNAGNNKPILLQSVGTTSHTIIGEGLVNEAGTGDEAILREEYHIIGTTNKSIAISKEFLDVDDGNARNIAYNGMRVSEMSLAFAFGNISTGRFTLAGNGYSTPTAPITNARTVDAAGSDTAIDASNGFGWLLVDEAAIDICLENLDITLNNNLQPANCIGNLAPKDQIPGTAAVTFAANMHLGLTSWDTFMAKKISQAPLSLAFYAVDDNGKGYAVKMDRVQVNFPDPASSGRDAIVVLNATGTASKDATTGQTMRIYKLG